MYALNSDKELNGYYGTAEQYNDSGNDNEDRIPRAKVQPIKKKRNNTPSYPTVKGKSLKATHNK